MKLMIKTGVCLLFISMSVSAMTAESDIRMLPKNTRLVALQPLVVPANVSRIHFTEGNIHYANPRDPNDFDFAKELSECWLHVKPMAEERVLDTDQFLSLDGKNTCKGARVREFVSVVCELPIAGAKTVIDFSCREIFPKGDAEFGGVARARIRAGVFVRHLRSHLRLQLPKSPRLPLE